MIFWIMLLIFIYIAEYLNLNRGMYFESSNKTNTNNSTQLRQTENGNTIRKAYWDDTSGVIVITDPKNKDGGTAFKPTDGKNYYDTEIH